MKIRKLGTLNSGSLTIMGLHVEPEEASRLPWAVKAIEQSSIAQLKRREGITYAVDQEVMGHVCMPFCKVGQIPLESFALLHAIAQNRSCVFFDHDSGVRCLDGFFRQHVSETRRVNDSLRYPLWEVFDRAGAKVSYHRRCLTLQMSEEVAPHIIGRHQERISWIASLLDNIRPVKIVVRDLA